MNINLVSRRGPLALFMAMLIGVTAFGQTVSTVPVGAVTVTIAAGTGTTRTNTVFSLPLLDTSTASGQMVGRITAVSKNTISNDFANWSLGGLSIPATPYLIRITSGVAAGRTFLVSTATANTSTGLTIDASDAAQVDLTSLGIVAGSSGDTYEIIPADTISSVFGTPESSGVLGGPSASAADVIYMSINGGWNQYYYNTTRSAWVRNSLGSPVASNQVIRPDAGIIYSRLGSAPINFTILGKVPSLNRKSVVANSGVVFLSTNWPIDQSLVNLGIQNISGWVSSNAFKDADSVSVFISGGWRFYWFDGTHWRRNALGNPISDSQAVSAATAIMITKRTSGIGSSLLNQVVPYSL